MKKILLYAVALLAGGAAITSCGNGKTTTPEPDSEIAKAVQGTYAVNGTIQMAENVFPSRAVWMDQLSGSLTLTDKGANVVSLVLVGKNEDRDVVSVWAEVPVGGTVSESEIDYAGKFEVLLPSKDKVEMEGTIKGSILLVYTPLPSRTLDMKIHFDESETRSTTVTISNHE